MQATVAELVDCLLRESPGDLVKQSFVMALLHAVTSCACKCLQGFKSITALYMLHRFLLHTSSFATSVSQA